MIQLPIDSRWAQLVLSVLAGMLAGGVTNHVAVWMLFHPYERRFGIQGAIPKNRARLARSLGRTVGERLVTPSDLLEELSRGGVREAFDQMVARFVSDLLETERDSLRSLLPPAAVEELDRVLSELADSIFHGVERYLESDEFELRVHSLVIRLRAELGKQSIGELVSAAQRDRITDSANEWARDFSRSPELEQGVRDYLHRHAQRLMSSSDPMVQRIPPAVLRALESAIENYLPVAAARLGAFLAHPAARDRIQDALHTLIQRLVGDLAFHQRIIARLMITERTLDRAIDALERDGVEQLAALLEDETVRDELIRTIREAVLAFLAKPVAEIVNDPDGERTDALVQAAGDYLLKILRDDRTHALLLSKIREVLERAEDRSLGDVMAGVSDDTAVRWLTEGIRSSKARELIRGGVRAAFAKAADVRIGRPARWLPADFTLRVSGSLSPALWDWMHLQLPGLIERLDIETLVERKVLGFDVQRVEEIIRGVTERELRLIVKLGYVLGGIIGLVTFGISMLFRAA